MYLGLWMKIHSRLDNIPEDAVLVFQMVWCGPTGSLQVCIARGSSFKGIGLKSYLLIQPSLSCPPTKGCGGKCLCHAYPPFSREVSGRSTLKTLEGFLWTPPHIYWVPQLRRGSLQLAWGSSVFNQPCLALRRPGYDGRCIKEEGGGQTQREIQEFTLTDVHFWVISVSSQTQAPPSTPPASPYQSLTEWVPRK